jgi:Chlorite dismutase
LHRKRIQETTFAIPHHHRIAQWLASRWSETTMNPNPRLFSFVGGSDGRWKVTASRAIAGDTLPAVERLSMVAGNIAPVPSAAAWVLRGATSNERYVTRPEKEQLLAKQPALDRLEADCAVLIPIRKKAKWWSLAQDERRAIFEAQSHHTQIGLEYLPAIARRLHHCRDLSEPEPFDFLTWFEFAKKDTAEFDRLLARLRASEEWKYVEREVEIRLTRDIEGETK